MSVLLFVLYGGKKILFCTSLMDRRDKFHVTATVALCAGWYLLFENKFPVSLHCDYINGNVVFEMLMEVV